MLRSPRTRCAQKQVQRGREEGVLARRSTPTRSSELRRAIAVARRLTTSVERAQGLTAMMANSAVCLAWEMARRKADGERRSSAGNGAAAKLRAGAAAGEGEGNKGNGGVWGSGVASRPGHAGRSRAAAAKSPTYGRHVADVWWRKAGRVRTRGRRGAAGLHA